MLVAALAVTQTVLAAPVINGDYTTGNESPWTRWHAVWGGPYTWQITSSGPTPPEGTLNLGSGAGSYGWFQRVAVTPGLEYSLVGDWAGDIGGAGWVEFMLFTGTEGQAAGEIINRIDIGAAADIAYKKDSWGMNPPTAWDWEPASLSPHPGGNGGVIQAVGAEIIVAVKLGSVGGGVWASFDNIDLVTAFQPEICGNGLDDDDDGYIDGYDPDCSGPPVCLPPAPPVFSIQQAWASTRNVAASMAVTVGDLDGDGDVEIIAPQHNGAGYRIYAGDGSNSTNAATDFAITLYQSQNPVSQPAMADVDRDGTAELIAVGNNGRVYVFPHTGGDTATNYEYVSNVATNWNNGSPRVADMDEDGVPEIVVGTDVFKFDLLGGTLTLAVDGTAATPDGSISPWGVDPVAADILTPADCGGDPACNGKEIAAGSVVYSVDLSSGTLAIQKNLSTIDPTVPNNSDGPTAVGDLDLDGDLDVTYADGSNFYIWDPGDDALLFRTAFGNGNGMPTVANVYDDTQDGKTRDYPEVFVIRYNELRALNLNYVGDVPSGQVWSLAVVDSSARTGTTAFDFNGDGLQEIVYRDESSLRIIDGNSDPPVDLATIQNGSATWMEHPVVADVDGDGQAEIVVAGAGSMAFDAPLRVYESAIDPWQPARAVWNQRACYVVNVNDDLSIPAVQQSTTVELPPGSGQHLLNRYNAQLNPDNIVLINNVCVDLAIQKRVLPGVLQPGELITYTLSFSNTAESAATGVVITDTMPFSLTNLSVISSGVTITDTGTSPPFVWAVQDLTTDQGGTITITGQISPTLTGSGRFTNTASIDSTAYDTDTLDNTARAGADIVLPALSFDNAAYSVDEACGPAVITLTLSSALPVDARVEVRSSDGTATAGGDYTAVNQTVTILAGRSAATFTVTIIDDGIDENDETVDLALQDPVAAQLGPPGTAILTIVDDDTAGAVVNPTTLTISEPADTDSFTICLTSQPTATVTVDLASSDPGECTVPASVALTPVNWQTGVNVAVSAGDDLISDGDQPCTVQTTAASSDPLYDGIPVDDVSVTVQDDEVRGVVLSTTEVDVTEGGTTAQYTVRLATIPTATVTISFNTGTQVGAITDLTFPPDASALTPQTVTVTAVDDALVEGDHSQAISHSASGGGYDGVVIADVSAHIADNDLAYAVTADLASLGEGDAGATGISFTVTRTGAVTTTSGAVDFALSGSATGGVDYDNVSPAGGTLSFGPGQAQLQITLDVLGDFIVEADETIVVTLANPGGPGSAIISIGSAETTIINDDTAGVVVNPIGGLITTEAGGTASFTVRLTSQPTAIVTIDLSSLDPGEGTVSPAQLTFDSGNWAAEQTVTVTGVDDLLPDGDVDYTIQTGAAVSSDPNYNGLDPIDVSVTNLDDDSPGIYVSPTDLTVREPDGRATFTIRLYTPPTAPVNIGLSSADPGQCSVSLASVALDGGDWGTGVTVTVTAVDDGINDGDQLCRIHTDPATSADGDYAGLDARDVNVTVIDIPRLYLPLIFGNFVTGPDLIVVPGSLQASANGVSLQIQNIGNAPAVDDFWVDVYVDPSPVPTAVNQLWTDLAGEGLVWGVTAGLAPGEVLTLIVGDAYYADEYSQVSWPLAVGTPIYAQADSWNGATTYGAVREIHEITGEPYNNIASTTVSASGGAAAPPAGNGVRPADYDHLPRRR
jgi:uncharacterized repeat protein (TIGR01451 family)